jgi:hypothetical protein
VKESSRLAKAFDRLARKYPDAAKELAKEFTAAIGVAEVKAKLAALSAVSVQVHTIVVKGKGRDGKIYTAEFEAVFPKGTVILNVGHK